MLSVSDEELYSGDSGGVLVEGVRRKINAVWNI